MNRNGLFLPGLLIVIGVATESRTAAQESPREAAAVCEVALRDGTVLVCQAIAAIGDDRWRLAQRGGEVRTVLLDQVLSLHGATARRSELPSVQLVGGDVVRGLLVGGDQGGNNMLLQSPVLGRLTVPVDRLECVVLRGGSVRAEDLQLPEGVDEALFQKARLGYDRIAGTVYQFGEGRVRFRVDGSDQPRWFRDRDLVGLRLAGGIARQPAATAELVTGAGDRLGVTYAGIDNGRVAIVLEDGVRVAVSLADLACLTFLDHGARFLSSLQPTSVRQTAFDGPVLLPWRRDAAVSGDFLTVGGRTHGRGIGAHSRSQLTFVVPDGCAMFWSRVVFDDSALSLPVRGIVDVRVEIGGEVAFDHRGMRAGDEVVSTGLLPVEPGLEVTLVVDFGAGRDIGDRVDWISPVFLVGDSD